MTCHLLYLENVSNIIISIYYCRVTCGKVSKPVLNLLVVIIRGG